MRKVYLFLLVFFFLSEAQAQWKKTGFPTGEAYTVFATDYGNILVSEYSENPDNAGVFVSEDAGDTFSKTPLPNYKFTTFCTAGDYVFAGGKEGRIGRSSDDGLTWELLRFDRLFDRKIDETRAMVYHDGKLFVGINGAGVVYTEDFGEKWILTDTTSMVMPFDMTLDGRFMTRMEVYGDQLYVIASHGFFVYNEETNDWTLVKENGYYAVSSEVFNDKLFVGYSASRPPFIEVYGERDEGVWIEIEGPANVEDSNAWSLIADDDNGILYCATSVRGVFYTEDEGATWKEFSEGLPESYEYEGVQYYESLPRWFTILDDKLYVTVFSLDSSIGGVYVRTLAKKGVDDVAAGCTPEVKCDNGFITVMNKAEGDVISVTSLSGAVVYSGTDSCIDMSSCPVGVYVYSVRTADAVYNGKVVVK